MLPSLYHAHNSLHSDDLPFWLELAERQGGPILELGCGTGRVTSHLSAVSGEIFGLDRDRAMLEFLIANTPASAPQKTQIFQADFTKFHLGSRFNLIILACNTYSTLTADLRQELLDAVTFHLHPGGMFAASMPNPILLRKLPRQAELEVEDVFPHPEHGEPVQVSSAWVRSKRQMNITWLYDCMQADGSVERLQYQVLQNIIPVETVSDEFHSAGLRVKERYGDFDGSAFTDESAYLILVSSKEGESSVGK